jgi:hypothetical protein
MATLYSVWVPNSAVNQSGGGILAANTSTGPIYIGFRQIFRIWSSATMNMNIAFGNSSVAAPTATMYAIGPVPQEFDTGNENSYINLANNNTSISSFYYQIMNKF